MVEYKTLRVPEPAYERAKDAKGDGETWGEYLKRCSDEPRIEISEDELRSMITDRIEQSVVEEALR